MTREEIAERLLKLSYDLAEIGTAMDYYGGFASWAAHGSELAGASLICKQWGQEILSDVRNS